MTYKKVKQRWFLIYSQQAYDREIITLNHRIKKEGIDLQKQLVRLSYEQFGCQKDIDKSVKQLSKTIKYHKIDYTTKQVHQFKKEGIDLQKQLVRLSYEQFGCQKDIDKSVKQLSKTIKYHKIDYTTKQVHQFKKEGIDLQKQLVRLSYEQFGCQKDIDKSVKQLSKTIKYHKIDYTTKQVHQYKCKGRPSKDTQPLATVYQVVPVFSRNEVSITQASRTKGRFVLATNQWDIQSLPNQEVLSTYKEQAGTEAGFKFIKDNTFEVDSIFLKKPGRINALMMIMTLCLMTYSFAQYFLRQQLITTDTTVTTQSGKQTKKPTMKWIYRLFHGIHLLDMNIDGVAIRKVLNIDAFRSRIIRYFGPMACSIYEISDEKIAI
ncbi:hypothetical protein CCPUN_05260 [Cardinium endosymbiont of Culicoides punctatus]|nr:hypothetical protein CCPUN_05260 [Cardinium endosymbiont of Culicoides punctatus]